MQQNNAERTPYALEIIKGLVFSLILTLAFVLLSALIVKIFSISTQHIPLINQINRTLSIFIPVIVCFKGGEKGYLRGAIFGLIYVAITFILFSLINGEFLFGLSLVFDLILGGVSGLISGIIAVNLRK